MPLNGIRMTAMDTQALYRRWRPQQFEDVLGQPHVTQTLKNALRTGRLAHAYLFTGPRGTGKTTVARILAKAACCLAPDPADRPCNACSICAAITAGRCLDVMEIDAASNTGVDDVRDLREKIGFSPNEARYKVYIIDEVHMLSTAAFNALLKTLEEPPAHALFILATTEPHKIPQTILSRCQRHDLRRVSLAQASGKLAMMCEAEGATPDRAALDLIARSGTGSLRDAESLLDQLLATGEPVTLEAVREVLGTPPDEAVAVLIDAMIDGDAAAGLRQINASLDRGADAKQLLDRLLDQLRAMLLLQTGLDPAALDLPAEHLERLRGQAERLPAPQLVPIIHRFNAAAPAANRALPGLPLELALVESILALTAPVVATRTAATAAGPTAAGPSAAGPTAADARDPKPPSATPPARGAATTRAAAAPPPDVAADPAVEVAGQPAAGDAALIPSPGDAELLAQLREGWPAVLAAVELRDRNLAALLKDARPVAVEGAVLSLGFFYPFHAKRAGQDDKAQVITAAMKQVWQRSLQLRCLVVSASDEEQASRPRSKAEQAGQDPLVRFAVESLGASIGAVKDSPDEPGS